MIAAGLLALLAVAPVGASEGSDVWRERAPVPPEGAPDEGLGLDHARGVERALSEFVLEHGDRARLWGYGASREGRALLALELHAERSAAGWRLDEGPTIVVLADLERDAASGAREVMDWAERLVLDDESLARARWLLVPAPAPDRLAPAEPEREREQEIELAWDFPAGWDPWSTRGAGAYPLRAPETRALAAGLSAWGTGSALVVLGAEERRAGGSVEAYARALGWKVLGLAEAGEGDRERAAALLSRVELETLSIRRATPELWELEVRIRTDAKECLAEARLELGGARLLAAARRSGADATPVPVDPVAGTVDLAAQALAGDERIRLLVRGGAGDRVRIQVRGRGFAPRVAERSLIDSTASAGD